MQNRGFTSSQQSEAAACISSLPTRKVHLFPMGNTPTTLVGGFNPFEKYLCKMDHFPNFRGENKKYLSCHHQVEG